MSAALAYQVGQSVSAIKVGIREAVTKPPENYTDGMLIDAMTNIHKFVTDPKDRQVLKEAKGLGTERTRDAIIETLVKRGFLERRKKRLFATPFYRAVLEKLAPSLKDPVMTAKWEMALGMIESGGATLDQFMGKQVSYVKQIVEEAKGVVFDIPQGSDKPSMPKAKGDGEKCPKCGTGTLTTKKVTKRESKSFGKLFLSCSNYPECQHTEWPN